MVVCSTLTPRLWPQAILVCDFPFQDTGPLYAAAKGLAVGGMAAIMELRYPGIVLNATMLTMGTAFSLFAAFQARLIDVRNANFCFS